MDYSEDVNIGYLLDVFTTIDTDSQRVWDVCSYFVDHLSWHKPRLVLLGPKIEVLPDTHPSKPRCLFSLSDLYFSVGNCLDSKRLLIHTLQLWREQGDDSEVAQTSRGLSEVNRLLDLHEEGIKQAKEAFEIYERLNDTFGQAQSLCNLAWLLYEDQQLGAAEEAALQSINLFPVKVDPSLACRCHRILGKIHSSKDVDEIEKAIDHFEAALGIASFFDLPNEHFWGHYDMAELFFSQGRLDDAHAHVERAKSHTGNDIYLVGRAISRLGFGMGNAGSEKRGRRLCVPSMLMRRSGPR